MSNQLLSSKVVLTEKEPQIVSVTAQPTAVLGMVGITQRGPVGVARQYLDFASWVSTYGPATADSLDTWLAVQAYFEEGGQFLWFMRTAHYTDITNAASLTAIRASATVQTTAALPAIIVGVNAAPFVFSPNDDISISVSGGGAATATFTATQATLSAAAGPYAITNGQTLELDIDSADTQTFTFLSGDFVDISNATAQEVADVLNATLVGASAADNAGTLEITSDTFGTSSGVTASGGTAAAAFTFGGAASGTGNVANIAAVTYSEFETILEAAVAGIDVVEQTVGSGIPDIQTTATGAAVTLEITASTNVQSVTNHAPGVQSGSDGTAVNSLRFIAKYEGAFGNSIVARVTDATSGEADRFNLEIAYNGIVEEVFPNLTMDDADTEGRFIEGVLAQEGVGSELLEAVDLDAAGATQRPANGSYTLVGGDDGLVNLADSDFIGSSVSLTGIRGFDNVSGITLLAVPARPTAAVHNAMVNYAENVYPPGPGLMLALLEPPEGLSGQAVVTYFETTAGVFWPRITVRNPNRLIFGNTETIVSTVTGHVAGVMARTDSSQPGGVHIPAAGLTYGQIQSAQGFEPDPDGNARHQVTNPTVRDLVYPKLINPIAPNSGVITIDGTRTLRSDSNFPGWNERRTVIFLETQIRDIANTFRHQRNNRTTRQTMGRSISTFLLAQMALGAFRSDDPDKAFIVDVSDAINTDAVQAANQANVRVHLATNKALDYIVIEFAQIFADVATDGGF
jgi:hypothetical protein